MSPGLLVIHVDGLNHSRLVRAASRSRMPYVARMLQQGYEALPYRCGIPCTTPYVQAGILYGDTSEIPSYRWYDRERRVVVKFGRGSTFRRVADKYFQGRTPLTQGGACIAALYAAGAKDRFGPASEERKPRGSHPPDVNRRVITGFLSSPRVVFHWLVHGGGSLAQITVHYLGSRLGRRAAARKYVVAELFQEILVHHLTRYAIRQAIDERLPVIYAGIYTYDETAHAFGPDDEVALRVLSHIDHTIRLSAEHAADRYRVVVLSDHGQVRCRPFSAGDGKSLGRLLADRFSGLRVEEHDGGSSGPSSERVTSRIALTYSGGLAHLYFLDASRRLDRGAVESHQPALIEWLTSESRVDFVMVRDGTEGVIVHRGGSIDLGRSLDDAGRRFLSRLDDPDIIAGQLRRLNSFQQSGDLVIFAHYDGQTQVDFEDQVGGHGSAGGEQLHPFILARREWGWNLSHVTDASELYPLLRGLRDDK